MKLSRQSLSFDLQRKMTSKNWSTGLIVTFVVGLVGRSVVIHSSDIVSSGAVDSRVSSSLGQSTSGASASFKLAREQSFGFFTDISDENWRRAQEIHAKGFPNHFRSDLKLYSHGLGVRRKSEEGKWARFWYSENFQEEFHCPLARRLPSDSNGDGPKWVCDPHRLANKPDCLVYSVGSFGKVEFEKAVKEEIGSNCEIHTFDVVTSNKENGDFKTNLEGYAEFHHWGLGTEEQAREYASSNKGPELKSLAQTMKELGHEGRTIDIFKIDCEGCEWLTHKEWIQQDLRQILVETHLAPMPNAQDFFYGLHDAGYVIFSKEANYIIEGAGVEFGFLKLREEFFVKESMYSKLDK